MSNIYRIKACDSVMCVYFCIGFIDFTQNQNLLAAQKLNQIRLGLIFEVHEYNIP